MESTTLILETAWLLLTIVCITIILIGLKAAVKRTDWEQSKKQKLFFTVSAFIITWTGLLLAFSYQGFFEDFSSFPPKPLLAILLPLPAMFIFAYSKTGTQFLKAVPPHWIVYMQSFRIAVELFILMAFINNKLPIQMTFEGKNFDILSGILALPVGYILAGKRSYANKLAIAYNIIGILLLINILVIAVLSMPTPIRYFANEPANILVGQFPFVLLPGVLVPIAYTMHIFSLRQMLAKQKVEQPALNALSTSKA